MAQKKHPVQVDVGLSARAEIKAEVPTTSVGRLVDSLTDAIRPFTEAQGLKADQIRLQREDVMIEIARRAHKRLALEGTEPHAVPPRVLVPLIEKASLTDPDDAVLLEAWSSILASASKEARANHALFVDILSNLDAKHLQFLEFIGKTSDRSGKIDEFLGLSEDEILNIAEESINEITNNDLDEESGSNLLSTKLGNATRTRGSILIAGGMDRENVNIRQTFEIFGERNFGEFPEFITGALENMSLIRRNRISHNSFLGVYLWLDYHILTMFGFEFLYACQGRSIYEE
jgi:hypothetical protein